MIVAAIIAAVAALAAAGLSYSGNSAQSKMEERIKTAQGTLQKQLAGDQAVLQRELAQRQDELREQIRGHEYKIQQLNELYGPVFMLRAESRQLRERVGPPSQEWRLVDHIAEVKTDPLRSRIVEEILAINSRIGDLVIGRAGLLARHPAPTSFQEFLAHARLLQMSWEAGVDQDPAHRAPFPLAFDEDVAIAIDQLTADLSNPHESSSEADQGTNAK